MSRLGLIAEVKTCAFNTFLRLIFNWLQRQSYWMTDPAVNRTPQAAHQWLRVQ
jgi:hypothetical protein